MKLIPDNIIGVDVKSFNSTDKNFVELTCESKKFKSQFLFECFNNFDLDILNTLVNKRAYASSFLYMLENSKLVDGDGCNEKLLREDVNDLLHTNIHIVKENAPLLTNIGSYPLFESNKYILRGAGVKKIAERFNESVDIEDLTLDGLENLEYEEDIEGYALCPDCKSVFYKEDNTYTGKSEVIEPYSTLNSPYNEKLYYVDAEKCECPYCKYSDDADEFYQATTEDLYYAPNRNELLGIKDTLQEEGEGDGTQVSDIATKVGYGGLTKPKTLVLSDLSDLDIYNKGFLKNSKGQYQRGNYVIVKEGTELKVKKLY